MKCEIRWKKKKTCLIRMMLGHWPVAFHWWWDHGWLWLKQNLSFWWFPNFYTKHQWDTSVTHLNSSFRPWRWRGWGDSSLAEFSHVSGSRWHRRSLTSEDRAFWWVLGPCLPGWRGAGWDTMQRCIFRAARQVSANDPRLFTAETRSWQCWGDQHLTDFCYQSFLLPS